MSGLPLSPARRKFGLVVSSVALATFVACKHKSPPAVPIVIESDDEALAQESSSKVNAKAPAEPSRCREVRAGASFTIGESEPARDSAAKGEVDDQDEDDPVAMPFEAELGGVVGFRGGFAVGVLHSQKRGQLVEV